LSAYCLNCFEHPACRNGVCLPCLLTEPELLLDYMPAEQAPYPCDFLPGSPEKIAQLAIRFACRYELFHPEDVALVVITLQRVGSWGPTFDVLMPVPGCREPRLYEAAWPILARSQRRDRASCPNTTRCTTMNRREFLGQATAAAVAGGATAPATQTVPREPSADDGWTAEALEYEKKCMHWEHPGRPTSIPTPEEAWVLILMEELAEALQAVGDAHYHEHQPGAMWCSFCNDAHHLAHFLSRDYDFMSGIRWGDREKWAKIPALAEVCRRIKKED